MPDIELRASIGRQFLQSRLDELYKIFGEWTSVAYNQTGKAKEKFDIGQLRGKLAEEYLEAYKAMKYYARSTAKYRRVHDALEESCDVMNMAQILMPMFDNSTQDQKKLPDLRMMIVSLAYHHPIYGMSYLFPFDLSHDYEHQKLFSIWIKEVEGVNRRFRQRFPDERSGCDATIEKVMANMQSIMSSLEEISEQNNFRDMLPLGIDMRTKGVMLLGDVITNMMFHIAELDGVNYEDVFKFAIKKMESRDKRYYGIRRLDQK